MYTFDWKMPNNVYTLDFLLHVLVSSVRGNKDKMTG